MNIGHWSMGKQYKAVLKVQAPNSLFMPDRIKGGEHCSTSIPAAKQVGPGQQNIAGSVEI